MRLVRWFACDLGVEDTHLTRENVAAGLTFLGVVLLVGLFA